MKKQTVVFLSLIFLVSSAAFAQIKTVTNADLEKFRQKRLQSEKEYRENYERLGLPSPEELDWEREQDKIKNEEIYLQSRAERRQRQSLFQGRANDLKTQIASVDAQINYLRGQVRNTPNRTVIVGGGYAPYYPYGRSGVFGGFGRSLTPNVQAVRNISNSYPNAANIHGRATGIYRTGVPYGYGRYPGYKYGNPYYYGGYVPPLVINTNSSQDDLRSQLVYLEQRRAGLLAEWEMLEDEARWAGVKIN